MVVEVSMNNKKGFTLIELIATIVLITLSSTIIVLNLQGSTSKEDNSLATKNNKQITEAACNAIDSLNAKSIFGMKREECKNKGGCSVKLQTLISNGLIDGYATYDDTGSKINEQNRPANYTVNIKWVSENGFQKKTCELYSDTAKKNKIYPK